MAFWGAPREMADHAERACRAALGLQQALRLLNVVWKEAGEPAMQTRIGVHTGRVIVGNIGSDERLAYTIIGDGVNLAARLEGLAEPGGLCISGDVQRQIDGKLDHDFEDLGEAGVDLRYAVGLVDKAIEALV